MKKRACSLILALAMILSLFPIYAMAEDRSSWDLLDAGATTASPFSTSIGAIGGTVEQKDGYVNILKGNDKSTSNGSYTYLTAAVDMPETAFTLEAAIRLAGDVTGDRSNGFSVRVGGYLYHAFLKYGTAEQGGGISIYPDYRELVPVDTTVWHYYAIVANPETKSYALYVDGEQVAEHTTTWTMNGSDLIRFGADTEGYANMDVETVRAGSGDLSSLLTAYEGGQEQKPSLTSVQLSQYEQAEKQAQTVTVTVTGENLKNDTQITAALVNADGTAEEDVTVSGVFQDNRAELSLSIPDTITTGTYYVEARIEGSTLRSQAYTVKADRADPQLPAFSAAGYTIEMENYRYNPTEEFNFPTIVDTKEHPVDNELGDYRYYLFYAPHDAPAGNCVAASNSLDGPWVEYEGNPVVSNKWDSYYDVSHVSSPHVMWIDEQDCYVMYYHGPNNITRYATSSDLLNWTYGGVCMEADDFSTEQEAYQQASYARVFEYEVPGLNNKYIMLMMVTHNGANNSYNSHIGWAYSSDGISWTAVKEPLVDPDINTELYGPNLSGPWFMPWQVDGEARYFVICHASDGNMYAFEVGEKLDECIEWGLFYDSQGIRNTDDLNPETYPDYGRAGAPCFIQDDNGNWHMFYEGGKRLHANIVHAVEVKKGEEGQLARASLELDGAVLQTGDKAEPVLRIFDKGNNKVSADAEGLSLTYHVSDSQVLSYENGVLTAVGKGTASAWVEISKSDGSTAVSTKVSVTVQEQSSLWNLFNAGTAPYGDNFNVVNTPGGGAVMQKAGYVNIEKGNDKSNTATGDAYTWLTAAPALPADEVFTVEATIRLSGAVDGGRTNEFAVRINGTGKYYPIFLKYGADGAVTNQTSFDSAKALDTTSWHNYALVINPTAQQYDVYVDGELVLEDVSAQNMSGGNLIRLGADNKGRCDMDVLAVRVGEGDLSESLTGYDGPEYPEAGLTSVTLSPESQVENTEQQVTVTVTGENLEDDTEVTVTLMTASGAAVQGVSASGVFADNQAQVELTIPDTVPVGSYYVEAEAAGSTARSGAYQVTSSLEAPDFPTFAALGYTIEMTDYQYNPTEEFNFPTIVDTKDHPVSNSFGDNAYRYYLFYAPHDAPAGNCVAVSNSLYGPWIEYENNPVVGNKWDPYYSVSHVSSPQVMWIEERGCYVMYFHGENPTTRYATSTDLLHWTYGGEIVHANDFSKTGSGFSEASYARVFEHTIPELDNKYIMLLMITGSGNNMHRNIYYAYSDDGITWTPVQEPLLNPDELGPEYKNNFSGPWFMEWDGRYFVICHASSGEIYAFEVGESLDQCIEWGEVYNSQGVRNVDDANPDAYPDYGRAGAPFFIQDDEGRWHMYYEAGKRLNTNIVHAVEVRPGEKDQLARVGVTLDSETLTVGAAAEPELRIFNKGNEKVAADTEGLTCAYHVGGANPDCVTYDNGVLTAVSAGEATIWVEVTAQDGSKAVSDKIGITVKEKEALPKEVIITNQMTPNKTALNLELPAIFKAEGVLAKPIDNYYLYFSYNDESGGTRSIALATAPAPEGPWTVYNDGTPVMTAQSLGVSSSVNAPWPIWDEDNGRMLMYYSMGATAIGVAESTDGINFTNIQTVLEGSDAPAGTQAYQQSVYAYTVEGQDNKYVMFYSGNGYRSGDGTYTNGKQIFYAVSDDGLNWTDSGKVLQYPDSGDKGNIASPRLMIRDGEPYVVYHNSNGNLGYSLLSGDFSTASRQGRLYDSTDGEPDRGRAADACFLQEGENLYLYYTARSNKAKNEEDASLLVCRKLAGGSGQEEILFQDDFNDGNADGWEVDSGTWTVTDSTYTQSAASGGAMTFAGDAAWSNYEVEVKVTPTETSKSIAVMVSGRADGTQNRYIGAYNGGKLMIDRRINGGSAILAQKEYTMELGQTYTLKMTFSGDNIALYVNGVKELETVDDTHTSGKIGLATYNTAASFDDVIVRAVNGAPEPSEDLTVEDFGDHQVVQRDAENKNAVITVNGTVTAEGAEKVEARVMAYDADDGAAAVVDWTEMSADLSAGTWGGSLTVPQGGWYRLEVRASGADGQVLEQTAGAHKWGVGINILCIGQSNMVGQAQDKPRTEANDLVANYTRSGQWTHLVDPYDGAGGSLVPALGNSLVEKLGIPVGFIPAADSGSGLHAPNVGHAETRYWMYYNAENPGDTTTLYGKALTRAKAAGGVELMVWNQGETDGRLMIAEETYEQDMKTLLARFRTDLGDESIPMFLCQIGTHDENISNDAAYTAIRNAQHDLDDGENFFLAATEMEFARKDTAHYTQPGLDEIGRRVANSILYYYGQSDYYRGPYITGAEYVDGDRSVVDVNIAHRGGSDIVTQGQITGFTVLDGMDEVEITSTVRQDSDTIRLTLAQPVSSSGRVRYLYGLNPEHSNIAKDNTPLQLPVENTTSDILISGDEMPKWDLMDHAMAPDWTADGWRSSTKTGSITQQDEYVNISKPNESGTGSQKLYHWVVSPTTLALPRDGFTLQVEARVAGMVDEQANEIAVRMGMDANDANGKIASIFLGYGEDGFVSTTTAGNSRFTMPLDTTVWHTFSMVVRLDEGAYVFDLYVDNQLAFENVPLNTYKGGDLIRLGADNGGRCNLDVKHVRLGTGEVLPDGVSPARVTKVTLSEESQKETESRLLDVTVAGTGFADGETVTLTLVNKYYQAVEDVDAVVASFTDNTARAQITIPSGLDATTYYVKAEANGRVRYSGAYTVEADRAAPVFPQFTAQGYTIEMEDYIYNPTQEFNFPTIVDTKDHPVSNELGDYRYYLFYAPHDAPAGNCVAASNSLDGPWVEYEGNPVVGNTWDPYYDVSHVSSPYVMWLEEKGCYIMYFHGENPVTRYALSDDLIHWEYGGECLRATDFRSDGGEASYARVFEHTIPELGNKYIMLLMISPTGGFSDKNRDICWAYSDNGTDWTAVQEPLLDPTMNDEYQGNFSGPWFMPWEVNGEERYFVICHASSGNMYAFEVGESLNECIEWGVFYDSNDSTNPDDAEDESAYPDYGRAGAPCFIQDDEGRWHMFYEGGKRLHANIVHATAPAPAPETPDIVQPGITTKVETLPDGSRLVTQTDLESGAITEILTMPNGVKARTTVTEAGEAQSRITIPDGVNGAVVELPAGNGNVAIRVNEDGTETVLPIACIENGRARIWLEDSAVVRFEARTVSFADIADGEIRAAAEQLAAQGIFAGTGGGNFTPGLPVDRATLVTVLYRLDGMKKPETAPNFVDVAAGVWYADAVAWCQGAGVTNGVGGGRFAPDVPLTWEQTALMLYRYAQTFGAAKPAGEGITERQAALQWCAANGVGAAENPGRAVNRGQLALIVQHYIKALVG